ncbi:MAG: hypothetical protein ACOYO1_06870 [Bacteroidales bacterium]
MKIIIMVSFLLFTSSVFSQVKFGKETDYKNFMQSKTMVVLGNSPFSSYNEYIQNSIDKLWKITAYDFISSKEFNNKKNNTTFSFLMLSDASIEYKDVVTHYNMLNLIMGGKSKTLNDMPDLGSIPLSYSDQDESEYLYKIGGILQFMQYFIQFNLNHPNTDLIKLIRNIEAKIGNKEIWLLKDEVNEEVNTNEKIKKYYSGIVKFVSKEAIEEAIEKKDENIVFLHKIGMNSKGKICWKALINAGNGELLYFDQYKIDTKHPDSFTSSDFGKLKSK